MQEEKTTTQEITVNQESADLIAQLFSGREIKDEEKLLQIIKEDTTAFATAMGNFIKELEATITETENKIDKFKNQKFFKRIFSNTSKDIADILVDENKIILGVIRLTQGTVYLCYNNTGLLDEITDTISKQQENSKKRSNLLGYLMNGLNQAKASAKNSEDRFSVIEKIGNDLEAQTEEIKKELNIIFSKNNEQDERLDENAKDIEEIKNLDAEQDERLAEKDAKDAKHEALIAQNAKTIEELIAALESAKNETLKLGQNLKSATALLYVSGAIGVAALALSIISLFI